MNFLTMSKRNLWKNGKTEQYNPILMKGNNMSKKYTIEEIVDAIDLSCGDSGKTSKEVISILETDVKKNTEDYLKGKEKNNGV